jgi:predicted nucleic-acid-binding Zn-ribbon protein
MPLTEDQEQQLVSWCNARGICARCPMCGNNDWTTGEIVSPSPLAGASEFVDEEAASMVQIICDHCKLVMLFAAAPILGEAA